ncbi:MAG TPA: RluA family pseudouridine synthase [Beijerinckiaceae bacterium]|nr:RluA family pseudouridine synthase [Beijerinckiaceae bacterium]
MNQHAKRRQQAMRNPRPAPETQARRRVPKVEPAPSVLEKDGGTIVLTVESDEAGQRLDKFLAARMEAAGETLSRTRLKALIEDGRVAVDGRAVEDAGSKVRAGQSVLVEVPAPAPASPVAEAIPLTVVFEDGDLIVIDKPPGLVVHPAAGHASGTLVNALLAHCGESLSGVGGVKRPGIVHRLDKDTSGLMVIAKNDAAHQGLVLLFADHGRTLGLAREYLALVWGAPERAAGLVDAPIGRHPHHREKQAVVRSASGRAAMTHWSVERVFPGERGPRASLLRCRLETGRTHQIRVHMAHIGHPVIGDPIYASGFRTKAELLSAPARAALDALGRQALHATLLGFPHPLTGEILRFESPPPEDMARLIAAL